MEILSETSIISSMIFYVIAVALVLLRLIPTVRPLAELYLPLRLQWLPSALMAAAGSVVQGLSQSASLIDNLEIFLGVLVALILAAQKGIDGRQ